MSNSTEPGPPPTSAPTQIPRGIPTGPNNGPVAQLPVPADVCLNFNLLDGRVVCLSVPVAISDADADFIVSLLQAHVAAVVRRGR